MILPEDFIANLSKQINIPNFVLQNTNLIDDIIKISEHENISELIKILKIKLLLTHQNKSVSRDFEINLVLKKCLNANLNTIHDTIFYCLLNQNSFDTLNKLLEESFTYLSNENNKNLIDFHVQIIDVILEVCLLTRADNFKTFITKNNFDHLLIKLLYKQKNDTQKKIARDVIPKYINCTNNNTEIFDIIWNDLKHDSLFYKFLIIMEDFYLPQTKIELTFSILNDREFWVQLQNNLNCADLKKQSVYILRKAVNCLFINEYLIKGTELVTWDKNATNLYKTAWNKFFILCDISNEKQLHLIEPTFKLYNTLTPLHISWKKCVTKLFINHPHSAVIKYTISKILRKEWACDIETLAKGLNNNFLYEHELLDLKSYICELNRNDFVIFVRKICEIGPSPAPFYHICKAIEHYADFDLNLILNLIASSEKVPHLYIRYAIQNSIFSLFIKSNEIVNDLKTIIYAFYNIGYLKRNNCAWNTLINLLQTPTYKVKYQNYNFETLELTKENAVFIVLLEDARVSTKYIKNIDSNKDVKNILFECHIINVKKTIIAVENCLIYALDIINEMSSDYNLDYIEQIEYILETFIRNSSLTIDIILELSKFLSALKAKENYIYLLILSKPVVVAYDTFNSIHKHKNDQIHLRFYTILINTSSHLENNPTDIYENTIKRKIQSNILYTKLQLEKLLFQMKPNDNIFQITSEYFDKSGPDILLSVIDTIYIITDKYPLHLLTKDNFEILINVLQRCEKDIFSLRSNEIFRTSLNKYIHLLSQIVQYPSLSIVAQHFCRRMFEPAQTITGIRNEILEQFAKDLELDILVEALLYGPVLRKDQKIEFDTCTFISKDETIVKDCNIVNPCDLDRRVRSQSVCILLNLLQENEHVSLELLIMLKQKYEEFTGKRYFGDSYIHLTKLRILQTIHLLLPYLKTQDLQKVLEDFLLNCLVNESQQPSIKMLLQWLLVRMCNSLNEKEEMVLKLIEKTKSLKGTSCTSVFPILYHLLKNNDIDINISNTCLDFLLTFTMGQHFNIRYYAQITIKYIFEANQIISTIKQSYASIYKIICGVIAQTKSEKSYDINLAYTELPLSLETIYYDIPRLTNVSHTEWLCSDYFSGDFRIEIKKQNDTLRNMNIIKNAKEIATDVCDGLNVQKKIDTIVNTEDLKCFGNLIVVASLIDKAPNLGGLSRTCEIFGVRQYVLNNLQFIKNKEYQSLSLSSENWVDTIEIKIPGLPNYLKNMKKEGYTIIGAEQTSDSKRLDKLTFEKDTVLVLGNEKEGIPPNLIHLLDQCIEVPQFGQIRSLNVHVAGALFIWEYTKQHCKQ